MTSRATTASILGGLTATALLMTPSKLTWWCLTLTLAQACVHLACSRDQPAGWTLGLALQPPWATYSVLTNQPAFLITTTIVTIANLLALRRHQTDEPARAPGHAGQTTPKAR